MWLIFRLKLYNFIAFDHNLLYVGSSSTAAVGSMRLSNDGYGVKGQFDVLYKIDEEIKNVKALTISGNNLYVSYSQLQRHPKESSHKFIQGWIL